MSNSLIAQDLIDDGKKSFEAGDYRAAIHQFSKALLVDSKNKEALDYLRQMGLSGGVYGNAKTQLEQISDLGQEVNGYRGQVADLEEANKAKAEEARQLQEAIDATEKALQEKEAEARSARVEAEEIKKTADMRVEESVKKAEDAQARAEFKQQEAIRLHTDLYDLKNRLVTTQNELKEKASQWTSAEEQMQKQLEQTVKIHDEEKLKNQRDQLALEKELEKLRHDSLEMELQAKRDLEEMHKLLFEKSREAEYSHDRLILANYKLANTEQVVAAKEEQVLEFQEALARMQARVKFLEKKVIVQKAEAVNAAAKAQAAGATTVDFLKRQDKQIAELKEELLGARGDLVNLRAAKAEEEAAAVSGLRRQLAEVSDKLNNTQSEYDRKSEDYKILEERLQGLQERLGVVEKLLQSRDEQIKDMEQRLTEDILKMDQPR